MGKSTHYVVHLKVTEVTKEWKENSATYRDTNNAPLEPIRTVEEVTVFTTSRTTLSDATSLVTNHLYMLAESEKGQA